MRKYLTIVFVVASFSSWAQIYSNAFHLGWTTLKPLSDKEFIDKTSSAGLRLGYTKFVNERFGYGFEGSYSTLNDYIPLQTYTYPGGAYTTDFHPYLYYFTLMANAQYYFTQGRFIIPYASVGMGVAFTEYSLFYNAFEDSDSQASFAVRPEIGTIFRFGEYARWGIKVAGSYDYTSSKNEYFELDNFTALGFQVGVVFLNEY
jgi:opacity protein-like surface antigen